MYYGNIIEYPSILASSSSALAFDLANNVHGFNLDSSFDAFFKSIWLFTKEIIFILYQTHTPVRYSIQQTPWLFSGQLLFLALLIIRALYHRKRLQFDRIWSLLPDCIHSQISYQRMPLYIQLWNRIIESKVCMLFLKKYFVE